MQHQDTTNIFIVELSNGPGACIEQHLIQIQLLNKKFSGEETARELIDVLSTNFSIGSNWL